MSPVMPGSVAGDPNAVLILAWQALYQVSHPMAPPCLLIIKISNHIMILLSTT